MGKRDENPLFRVHFSRKSGLGHRCLKTPETTGRIQASDSRPLGQQDEGGIILRFPAAEFGPQWHLGLSPRPDVPGCPCPKGQRKISVEGSRGRIILISMKARAWMSCLALTAWVLWGLVPMAFHQGGGDEEAMCSVAPSSLPVSAGAGSGAANGKTDLTRCPLGLCPPPVLAGSTFRSRLSFGDGKVYLSPTNLVSTLLAVPDPVPKLSAVSL